MSKPGADGGYRLPAVVDPPKICITVPIPDDQNHRLAFLGQMLELTFWFTWQRDEDHTGAAAGRIWADVYEFIRLQLESGGAICADIVDVRQNATNPCILEKTYDGVTWLPFANIRLCSPLIRQQGGTGAVQVSEDDGETWTDIPIEELPPSAEPYVPDPEVQPGPDATKKCLAAANATDAIDAFYRETFGAFSKGLHNTLTGMNRFLRDVNRILFNLAWSPDEGLIEAELFLTDDVLQYWDTVPGLDETAKEELICLLHENAEVNVDGTVHFDFQAVYDNVIARLGIDPGTAVTMLLGYMQAGGLNRAGGIKNITTYDCSFCEPECGCEQDENLPENGPVRVYEDGLTVTQNAVASAPLDEIFCARRPIDYTFATEIVMQFQANQFWDAIDFYFLDEDGYEWYVNHSSPLHQGGNVFQIVNGSLSGDTNRPDVPAEWYCPRLTHVVIVGDNHAGIEYQLQWVDVSNTNSEA